MRKTCNTCKKRKWFVKQRQYNVSLTPNTPPQIITSKGMLCRSCYKNLKKLFKIK